MDVIDALEQARRQHDLPTTIRVDQGQFTSKELDLWAYANGVTLDFSRPGKPTDNAYVESFNATVRLGCLGRHWFLDLDDAREKVEDMAYRVQRSETT
jgi:putative transposase